MKVAITGAAGFIGSNLAERLLARGDDVHGIDDLSHGSLDNVAGLRDEDGRIQVAGFYDDVRPPTDTERQALREVPDVDDALRGRIVSVYSLSFRGAMPLGNLFAGFLAVALALGLSALFIAVYVFSVAEEARRMSHALSASQMSLGEEMPWNHGSS